MKKVKKDGEKEEGNGLEREKNGKKKIIKEEKGKKEVMNVRRIEDLIEKKGIIIEWKKERGIIDDVINLDE